MIKHYDSTIPEDEMQAQSRVEIKAKVCPTIRGWCRADRVKQLEKTLAVLKAKVAVLEVELEEGREAAVGGLFGTDDPEHQKHVVSP